MVEIRIEYQGDLRCKAVHGPSGKEIVTDAPVDNHGKGEVVQRCTAFEEEHHDDKEDR